MGRFAEYQTKQNINELAALCDARGISLKPIVDECYRLMEHTDLTDQEIYNELLGAVGRFAGNLATGGANLLGQAVGGIRRGVGAMANSFSQGYNQQAAGGQASAAGGQASAAGGQASAAGGQASAAGGQASAAGGQASAAGGQASAAGGQQPATAVGGDAAKQLQTVQQLMQKMGKDHQQINGLVTQLTQALSKQQAPAQAVKPT